MVRRAPSRRPSDAGPRKTPKILQEGGGELFGRNPGRVPKIGKKRRFDTFFGRFPAFRNGQNAVNYSIFAF